MATGVVRASFLPLTLQVEACAASVVGMPSFRIDICRRMRMQGILNACAIHAIDAMVWSHDAEVLSIG